jgi:hypothetical protein
MSDYKVLPGNPSNPETRGKLTVLKDGRTVLVLSHSEADFLAHELRAVARGQSTRYRR